MNSISPGTTETPMLWPNSLPRPIRSGNVRKTRRRSRSGIEQPDDIAAAVAFLLSDEAAYITGANLVVDSGRTSCFTAGALGTLTL